MGLVSLSALPAYAVKYSVTLLPSPNFAGSDALANTATNQVGYGTTASSVNHALLWNGATTSPIDITPAGYTTSVANAVSGTHQVGAGISSGGTLSHAILWNGTSASAVDLNPVNYASSTATGVNGSIQVGYGTSFDNLTHALSWSGSSASVVDLNPAGFTASRAAGASATNQIGQATTAGGQTHAILWSGTAASAIDLEPANYGNTAGVAVSGNNQTGYGTPAASNSVHALLWHGAAASVVDLHPAGWLYSYANAVSGNTEVGSASTVTTTLTTHAFLWTGTAASAVDLQQFVTSEFGSLYVDSEANSVTDNGTIVGRVQDSGLNSYAVLWKPETGIPGDYNNNGVVDMADYVRWRNGATTLFNEVATPGVNTIDDYTAWRARFGNTSASATAMFSDTAVPEPSLISLAIIAALSTVNLRSRH
ncbi:MAG TPA: hypothetical protein VH107_15060 [Lacipirellulaceae bacterium]|nr:hypothetical protein [Lacipirellulaceae bacterium]